MSMSIHTPPIIKAETSTLDQPAISNTKLSGKPNAQSLGATVSQTSLRLDDTQGLRNMAITPETALRQLFDMLESIFKAIRELFSGNIAMKPDSGKLPVLPGNSPRPNVPLDTLPMPDAPTPELTSPGPVDGCSADRHGRFNHRLSSRF
jgi:hypothetical protein